MKTRDRDIRLFLHEKLKCEYGMQSDTLIVDEFNLCQGNARIDIAVVNGSIHGYEIKSDSDTLERLPNQINIYNQVMDTITIVVGEGHKEKVIDLVPKWWGVTVAVMDESESIILEEIREPNENPIQSSYHIAQLLWREEALNILKMNGMEKGCLSKPKRVIWERLSNSLSHDELKYFVREQLKNRKDWRVGSQQR